MVFCPGCRQGGAHGRVAAILAFAWLACVPAAFAQQALFPKGQITEKGAEKGPAFEPEKLKASLEKELAEVRGRLDSEGPVPPQAIRPEERDAARKARAMLVHVLAAQLETLDQIEARQKAREAAEKAERDWAGFPEPPPYSNLLSDDIREQVATRQSAAQLLKSSRSAMQPEATRFSARAQQADEAMRRAAETLAATPPASDARAAAQWRLDAARDHAKLANALVASTNIAARELDLRLETAQAELRLGERQLATLAGNVRISKADLEGAEARLNAARALRDKELQTALAQAARWAREREAAAAQLEKLRGAAAPGRATPAQESAIDEAEARFRAADAWSNSLSQQVRILTVLMTLYHERILEAWRWRYTVLVEGDANARRKAREQLEELVEYLQSWQSRGRTQQDEVRSSIQEQDQRVMSGSDPAVIRYDREALDAWRELDLALDRQQALIGRRLGRLEYWREDFAEARKTRSAADVAGDLYVGAKSLAQGIWNYELLTIEDKVEIGGQTLTTSRGITVGKSIGALLLFLIGLRMMLFLSARMERVMVRRSEVGEQQAKMMRRWVNAFGVMVLLMITLNIARIPLTVFAFAGGALAIGLGFGMQTLIKNLISGVIVLLERQVRVGDVIEVEGVTGTVTAVDIRSSTVRGFDGVESMIPNASLLEQKVTNWTLTNAHLRRVVKIGVAYGSPVRTVARILEECALRHGVILKEPPPRLIFEDFGDNALVFALYFWIDLKPAVNSMQVMSDLRFMIEKELREAGIVVAFPQRDVHIDTTHPIRIELAPAGEAPAAQPAAPAAAAGPHPLRVGT